jgi:hypothetical protein
MFSEFSDDDSDDDSVYIDDGRVDQLLVDGQLSVQTQNASQPDFETFCSMHHETKLFGVKLLAK